MLLEEGFNVFSTDASDKMLKYALRERWNRRKEANFDNWGWIILLSLLQHAIIFYDLNTKVHFVICV